MSWIQNPNRKKLKEFARLNYWTPEKLRDARINLRLAQRDIAELMGVTVPCISALETGRTLNPWAVALYGIILERYWAGEQGYVPVYRNEKDETIYYGGLL